MPIDVLDALEGHDFRRLNTSTKNEINKNEKNNISNSSNESEMSPYVNTFLGNMPNTQSFKEDLLKPENLKEFINLAAGGPEFKLIGGALSAGKKVANYVRPSKIAEEVERFRKDLSPADTSSQNIENLSKRMKFARKSGEEEALIPKREIYSKVGEENIYPSLSESRYLSDPDVASLYSKKGKLYNLHENFMNNPIANNYDSLQRALKKQIRKLEVREKRGTLTETGEKRLEQYQLNRDNLDEDAQRFFGSLPEHEQGLEKTFRTKWATGPAKYEDAQTVIKKLSKGKASEVTDQQIIKVFTRPDDVTKKIIKELGPSVGKNVLYSALNKVKPGDYENMAETILELKRTKGFDDIVTKDIEKWANDILARGKTSERVGYALKGTAGAIAGGVLGGPVGATIGSIGTLGYPYLKEAIKKYKTKK